MNTMLDLKRLYGLSKRHISEMMGERMNDFRLEQAENTDNVDWDVVVSFLMENPNAQKGTLSALSGMYLPYERVYKRLLLDADGELVKYLIYDEKR